MAQGCRALGLEPRGDLRGGGSGWLAPERPGRSPGPDRGTSSGGTQNWRDLVWAGAVWRRRWLSLADAVISRHRENLREQAPAAPAGGSSPAGRAVGCSAPRGAPRAAARPARPCWSGSPHAAAHAPGPRAGCQGSGEAGSRDWPLAPRAWWLGGGRVPQLLGQAVGGPAGWKPRQRPRAELSPVRTASHPRPPCRRGEDGGSAGSRGAAARGAPAARQAHPPAAHPLARSTASARARNSPAAFRSCRPGCGCRVSAARRSRRRIQRCSEMGGATGVPLASVARRST